MIERTRKRPRVRSSSFRTLGWLVTREAAFAILWGDVEASHRQRLRVRFCGLDSRYVQRQAARHLQRYPGRRFHP